MDARITVLTIGVDNLERSLVFYRDGLGFETDGIIGTEFEHGAVAFFKLQDGLILAIWPRESIAHDLGINVVPITDIESTEFTIGHNVTSRGDVDLVIGQAREAGATITKAPHETFWGGYAGYFQDPDQHLWEVVWNPQWEGDS